MKTEKLDSNFDVDGDYLGGLMKTEKLDSNFDDVIAEKIMLNMHRYFQKCGILAIAEDFGKPLKYTLQYFAENKSSKYITYNGLEVVALTSDSVLSKIRINIKPLSDGVEISYSELKHDWHSLC